jgi:hypothetical protein
MKHRIGKRCEAKVPGSARVSRAGKCVLAIANFSGRALRVWRSLEAKPSSSPQNAATSTLQACAPQRNVAVNRQH